MQPHSIILATLALLSVLGSKSIDGAMVPQENALSNPHIASNHQSPAIYRRHQDNNNDVSDDGRSGHRDQEDHHGGDTHKDGKEGYNKENNDKHKDNNSNKDNNKVNDKDNGNNNRKHTISNTEGGNNNDKKTPEAPSSEPVGSAPSSEPAESVPSSEATEPTSFSEPSESVPSSETSESAIGIVPTIEAGSATLTDVPTVTNSVTLNGPTITSTASWGQTTSWTTSWTASSTTASRTVSTFVPTSTTTTRASTYPPTKNAAGKMNMQNKVVFGLVSVAVAACLF
ncbi:hypothetical protein BGZ49_004292 [Haplosporangium sp. Z 27]|nr:hypothetical protein BGZ49_004292 [Haplosporangium sp. Z 27]